VIKPEQIPQFTGDLFQLELAHQGLKTDAGNVRTTGSDVHSQFQGLSAYYTAPEAEQLFASTKPVKDRAEDFATDLETVSSALSSYATEIRPLVSKLVELKTKATTFVNSVKDDDDWEYDEDKVDEHNGIRDEITTTVAAFWAAERTCHNKITAIFGGTQMVAGDGSDRKDQYGFNAEDLKNAKLPWGDPVEEKHHAWEIGHWIKSFVWDGLIVDGVWGTIKGLGTLVGFGGWEAMGQAWKGLAQLATGLVITAVPGAGALFWTLPDDKLPSWLRDSRTAMKETGKALVAWDEWGKNPARAAGAVTFNVLTTVFTGGSGAAASGAGKAGAIAKALSVAGKAGKVIDPMTYVMKGAGAGLSKIGDISKALKGIGNIEIPKLPDNAFTLPEGALKLPDGTFHFPEGAAVPEGAVKLSDGTFKLPEDTVALPEGTTKLPTEAGAPAQYLDPHGNVLDDQGNVVHAADDAPTDVVDKPNLDDLGEHGPSTSGADNPHTPTPVKEPALVGAGTHTAEQAGHQHITLGSGLDDVGHVGDDVTNTPVVHAGGEHPVVHAGDNLPGGTAHEHGPGPSASHETPGGPKDGPGGPKDGPGGNADSPGGTGHDGPGGGGHEPSSTGGHEGGPGGTVDDGTTGGHGGGSHAGGHSGGGAGNHEPPVPGDRFSEGDRVAAPETGVMRPDQEAAVTAGLDRVKMQPQDQQRLLTQLRKNEYGAGVAEYIARGDFDGMPGYRDLLSQCKQKGMIPAVHQAMEHAADLQARGVEGLAFEFKDPGKGLDLDVLVRSGDEITHGVQLKDVEQAKGIRSAARKIAEKQLAGEISGTKVAILDVHDVKGALTESMVRDLEYYAERTGATFEVRFQDGSITVPANGQVYP
jgi:hypothetical protein